MDDTVSTLEIISNTAINESYILLRGLNSTYFFPQEYETMHITEVFDVKKVITPITNNYLVRNIPILNALDDIKKYVDLQEAIKSEVTWADSSTPSDEELQQQTDNYFSQKAEKLNRKRA